MKSRTPAAPAEAPAPTSAPTMVPDSGGPASTGAPIDAPASEGGPFHVGGEGPIAGAMVPADPEPQPAEEPEPPPPASAFPFPTILVRAKGTGTVPHVNEHGRDTKRARAAGRDAKGNPVVERVADHDFYRRHIRRGALDLIPEGGQ